MSNMASLYTKLALDQVIESVKNFALRVDNLAHGNIYFVTEVQRLTREVKALKEKIHCWDVLQSHGRQITEEELKHLLSERERITSVLRNLFGQLDQANFQKNLPTGQNGYFGTGDPKHKFSVPFPPKSGVAHNDNFFRRVPGTSGGSTGYGAPSTISQSHSHTSSVGSFGSQNSHHQQQNHWNPTATASQNQTDSSCKFCPGTIQVQSTSAGSSGGGSTGRRVD